MLVPPERGHQEKSVSLFPDSPDYLRDQSDPGKRIEEEIGPLVGQRIPVFEIIDWAMRIVFWGKEVYLRRLRKKHDWDGTLGFNQYWTAQYSPSIVLETLKP